MPRGHGKAWRERVIGAAARALLGVIHRIDRKRTANFGAALMRTIGPRRKEHQIGRANLRAAFPEKSDAEIENILAGVWDNLGRVAAEFAHLDEFHLAGTATAPPDGIVYSAESEGRFERLLSANKATLGFAAHLANWEIPAVGANLLGVKSAVFYRPPNIPAIDDAIVKLRANVMGQLVPASIYAPVKLAHLLESGVHVGMLVDQHYTKGVDVTFFGRRCKANPLIALLARQTEAPIYGMRVVRLPQRDRFWGEVTEPIEPPRGADGRIDIAGTMQIITSIVEGWVREHPEQWLWLHNRWR